VTDGPASPRRTGASGDDRPRPASEILAEATNLRAARLREALELARLRRLEAEAMHKERDQARRDRDRAREALDRLRARLVVRLSLWAIRHAKRALRRAKRAAAVGPGQAGGTLAGPDAAARLVGRIRGKPAAGVGPADYRSRLLARLGGKGRPILASVAGDSSEQLAGNLRSHSWNVANPAPGSAADLLIVTSPTRDPRDAARETILVAAVAGDPAAWTAQPWFDAFDLVLVRDEAAAEWVSGRSAKVATMVAGEGEAWPEASAVAAAVRKWASQTRIAVMVQALRWDVSEPSGDYHLARALQRQFERRGHPTSVYFQRQWASPATAREDVVIHLWGRYELAVRPTQVNALWILYHPELVTDELCRRYDAVFAASDTLARRLSDRTGLAVRSLHQATDPERFRPTPGGPHHELLFVANSRGTRRTIIDDLTPTARDLAVYGGGWADDLLDPVYFRGAVVSNRDLPAYYSAADIVLNDHWLESAEAGMINNRLYDALAAGALVISDSVPGLEEEFDGAVVRYSDPADLALTVERYLADPAARRALADRGRRAVLERHTVSRRADELLEALLPLVRSRDGDPDLPQSPKPPAARATIGARRR
jgi:glycosyl transferase family 1